MGQVKNRPHKSHIFTASHLQNLEDICRSNNCSLGMCRISGGQTLNTLQRKKGQTGNVEILLFCKNGQMCF